MTAHSKELNSERLRQLSSEVSRIATTLARLSSEPEASLLPERAYEAAPDISADTVMSVIRARRLRARFFEEELFADPAWDMMLELLHADLCGRRVSVSSLSAASGVPATTALRWLKAMVDKGLFIRRDDPLDGRRVYVDLAPETSRTLRLYFAEIEKGLRA
jgi:DNA-binding MarR family transcriptional regulator